MSYADSVLKKILSMIKGLWAKLDRKLRMFIHRLLSTVAYIIVKGLHPDDKHTCTLYQR